MSELTPYLRERLEEAKRDLAKQKAWYSELTENPLSQINGLVSLAYAHGDSESDLDEWCVIFTFDCWEGSDGVFHENELVVRKVVKQEESDRIKELVHPRSIISISCHIGVIKEIDRQDAALVSVINSKVSDERLNSYKAELETSVILPTDTFGDLKLDREINCFEGDVRSGLRKIRISLDPKRTSETSIVLAEAERIWNNRNQLIDLAKEQAADELLEIKNESWLNAGDRPLARSKFMKSMRLYSITVTEGEGYDFWFRDGDLFWGHDIEVRGDDQRGFFQAGIQG